MADPASHSAAPRSAAPRDPFLVYGLFRILLALCIGAEFFSMVLPDYAAFYTDAGLYPRALALAELPQMRFLSLLFLGDTPLFHAAFIAAFCLAWLAYLFGYRTRLAAIVLLVLYASLFYRNIRLSAGGDMLMRVLLVWSLFLPVSRHFGIDAALDPAPKDRPFPRLPIIAFRIQIALIYVMSVLYKLAGTGWIDGTAVRQALAANIHGGKAASLWLIETFPALPPVLTWGVIAFQLAFTPLIYCPWRNNWTRGFAVAAAALMHLGFMVFLNIGVFPFVCLAYLVTLMPAAWPEKWQEKLPRLRGAENAAARFRAWAKMGAQEDRRGNLRKKLFPARVQKPPGRAALALCGAVLGALVLEQALTVPAPAVEIPVLSAYARAISEPRWLHYANRALQVTQKWDLFAPDVEHVRLRITLNGYDGGGERFPLEKRLGRRLVTGNGVDDHGDPKLEFPNHKWLKFFIRLSGREPDRVDATLAWLCREAARADGHDLAAAEIIVDVRSLAGNEPFRPVFSRRKSCANS